MSPGCLPEPEMSRATTLTSEACKPAFVRGLTACSEAPMLWSGPQGLWSAYLASRVKRFLLGSLIHAYHSDSGLPEARLGTLSVRCALSSQNLPHWLHVGKQGCFCFQCALSSASMNSQVLAAMLPIQLLRKEPCWGSRGGFGGSAKRVCGCVLARFRKD